MSENREIAKLSRTHETVAPIVDPKSPMAEAIRNKSGQFAGKHPFGGPKPSAGRKPMPDARKRALAAFHQSLPEAVDYLVKCLRSQSPDDQRWAAEWFLRKGIPNIEALLVRGQLNVSPNEVSVSLNFPGLPVEIQSELKRIADKAAMLPADHTENVISYE